jgi:acyl-CoA synthetase (AMP-forming)/AMP-acid ligase II
VPKGVELTGRNLGCALHELHASIELDEGSVCAAPVPFFHVAGLGMLLAANLNGGNLLLEQQADIAGVLRLLVDREVTHAVLVPTVLQRLLALPEASVTGGENMYPAEVESVLTGHPAVAEVAVVGVPSARWGESPYAVVVLRPGAQVSEAELIAWTRDRLAHFKCPAGVSFAASLARTASGKLQEQAIRASLSSVAVQ